MTTKKSLPETKYSLNEDGYFVIENYNESKPFCNFFPGIAGIWGIPMWVFYVNRGQCIASFGVESKDKAVMEFQPANKSYRLTSTQGFRTFIKAETGSKTFYWEPFQNNLEGTRFKKKQTMSISAHDLTLEEVNLDLGLTAEVNYFTLPEKPYSALVRRVTIKNSGKKNYNIEMIDGLPAIVPYGLKDDLNKFISRTVEAWVKVRNLNNRAPFFQLNVEVSDKPEVTHIDEGNFYFSFDPEAKKPVLFEPIVEAECVFGQAMDFLAPVRFMQKDFLIPKQQETSNRTPSAMSHASFMLNAKEEKQIVSLVGYAHDQAQLKRVVTQALKKKFVSDKAQKNKEIIDAIKNYALTKSSSSEFDLYASHTFLDNILRGGLPISLKTGEGHVAFNVYSRKHGDLERDYNYFWLSSTFYSQGNGNYRDVNQNRRNDVWFNPHVKNSHLVNFLNLSQADGYNPLVVKGATFRVVDTKKLNRILADCVIRDDRAKVKEFVTQGFAPGDFLKFLMQEKIGLNVITKSFISTILEICQKQELAEHGEGFWSDHWTYNLDLIESYLSVYPEDLKGLLLNRKDFHFYHNSHYVLPRNQRYILTDRGVRQYRSVADGAAVDGDILRVKGGRGNAYSTNLACKLLCLIANKVATLDPSGIGIEMEADKPNWYDALNGLPGLLGSSVSETFELKRLSVFLLNALDELNLKDDQFVLIFEELANFISGLVHVLSFESNAQDYWEKSNDLKEHYRQYVRQGIEGSEVKVPISEIKQFLGLVITRTDKGIRSAKNDKGFLATYFYHKVTDHEVLDKISEGKPVRVRPLAFKKHVLPLFLEGYVHALRVENDQSNAKKLYEQVRKSNLFDKKLKMYKVNADLSGESEEIGRTRIFPAGWLENESIWLHMEYKFILELIRSELYEDFYQNLHDALIPFLDPEQYGRSILESSSFLVSSAHEDENLHGRGFVARLSGNTAEFMHIWLIMNMGKKPFSVNAQGELILQFQPALDGRLFTKEKSIIEYFDLSNNRKKAQIPKDCYAFNLFGSTLVIYHNPRRQDTFGAEKPPIKEIKLTYPKKKEPVVISGSVMSGKYAHDARDRQVERIDIFFA